MTLVLCRAVENKRAFLIAGKAVKTQHASMKKFFAVIVAGLSAWVLFTPLDLPPIPFFFIDEAIALLLFTKSMSYLGVDISRLLPFLPSRRRKNSSTSSPADKNNTAKEPVIDV